jgi:hypothetical protein
MRSCAVSWIVLLTAGCQAAASMGPGAVDDDDAERSGAPQAGGSTSDFGGDTIPCPCATFQFHREPPVAVRVTVEAQTGDDRFSLRLRDVLVGSLSLAPDEIFEATWDGTFPCYTGCSGVSVGDDAFAFYWVDAQACPERERCIADCDAENAANDEQVWESQSECSDTHVLRVFETGRDCEYECGAETAEVCPDRPEPDHRRGSVRLAPWTDPLVFARSDRGELSVPLAELDELWPTEGDATPAEIAACTARFGDWSDLLEHAP